MIISSIQTDLSNYDIDYSTEELEDMSSYIYSPYGTFEIIPVTIDDSTGQLIVNFNDMEIGQTIYSTDTENSIAFGMSTAIDIVTDKIEELISLEERDLMQKISDALFDSIYLTDEQRAMFRAAIVESGQLENIIEERETPTLIIANG